MAGRMKILKVVYLIMPAAIVLAFVMDPPSAILGETSRIIYFHVPIAWVSVLAFVFSGIASSIYLADKKNRFSGLEDKAHASAAIGIVFCILTVITGSMWAKLSWGSFWNWDPRETSIVVLLLVYFAYFSLHAALEHNGNRGRICSSYLIFAMTMMPLFVFIIPRIYPSLHPETIINANRTIHLDNEMRITLLISVAAFTMLYFYLLDLMNRLSGLEKRAE